MHTQLPIAAKRFIRFPAPAPPLGRTRKAARHITAAALLPIALLTAWWVKTPGLQVRLRCIGLGLRAIRAVDPRRGGTLILNPMDSFRYFELDFVQQTVASWAPDRYLDVSSPRLVPLLVLDRKPAVTADIINPIGEDLRETRKLAKTLGLLNRSRLQQVLVEDAAYPEKSFDLITCVSVLEHIPDDVGAVAAMWRLLRPGGRLILTVPCARHACEEYTDFDEYGLIDKTADGFVFWQRYYSEAALTQRIWSVTGQPARTSIFGEVEPGSYDENVTQKRTNPAYPYWREPMMMGRKYRYFEEVDQLPGMGVIGMEFHKRAQPSGSQE